MLLNLKIVMHCFASLILGALSSFIISFTIIVKPA